jgi:tight adherence protein B
MILNTVAPDFYRSIWHHDVTKMGLGAAGAWMMIGNLIMYRLVNFKI